MSPVARTCMLAGHLDGAMAEHQAAAEELRRLLAAPVDFAALADAARRTHMAAGALAGFATMLSWEFATE